MIRDAKDPQRLLNYARTTEAESTALQPKAPFILTVSADPRLRRHVEPGGQR